MVKRKEYLAKLSAWREKNVIKIVSGVRRCGKSTLLMQYIELLKASGVKDEQIISINLEEPEYEDLLDQHNLYKYILKRLCKNKYTYIFIDEIQHCQNFEKAVDGLFVKKFTDLYITGSNAYFLSGELATMLSGRYIEMNMLPLSFREYLEYKKNNDKNTDIKSAFNDYMYFGSFPYTTILNSDPQMIKTYIDGIYSSILIKDVAKRTNTTDITLLENIVKFLSQSAGSTISIKNISDTINSTGRSISVNTVETYIRNLTDSFIFYQVNRYDIKGKQHLKTLGKYYIVDTGIRNMLLESSTPDLGHQIENIVYLELLRRGFRVSIGKVGEKEVDFVAAGNKDKINYYQVAASVMDSNTMARELSSLQKINDNHPKYLLALDDIPLQANHDGIVQLNLINWLLDD